ncbi:mandelate racemase/muconate lactonizing enzyme family protein [soil metagenome]
MKTKTVIRGVKAYEVVVPSKPGAINSPSMAHWSGEWDLMPIVLLELHMDDGLIGLGEVGRGVSLKEIEFWLQQLPGLVLNGWSLACLPQAWRGDTRWGLLEKTPPPLWSSPSPVIGAVEVALLDWAGKRLGCRVVDLLGGQVHETLPVDYWCARQTPEDLVKIVKQARTLGFNGLKMKSKIGDPIVEQVRAIKETGGHDFHLTIDPMCQWLSPADALFMLKQLEPYAENVQIEDPFPQDMPEMWQRVRQASPIPLALHARGLDVLRSGLQDRFADNYNVSGYCMTEFLTMARTVEVAGYACWHGSSLEMGVMQLARMHATAAARACVLPSDFQSNLIRQHTLITWDWPYQNGHLTLPAGDGLGAELDYDAIDRFVQAEATFQ